MTKMNGRQFAEAVRLTSRSRQYMLAERELVIAVADSLLERGEPYSRVEQKILDRADVFRIHPGDRDPEPEGPEVDEAGRGVADAATKDAAAEAVRSEVVGDVRTLQATAWAESLNSKTGTATAKTLAKLRAAEAKLEEVSALAARAKVNLTEAYQALDAARRALLAERQQ